MTQLVGFGAGDIAASISYVTQLVSTSDLTTYTFTAAAIGTAAGGRYVVVGVSIAFSTTRSISSVTVAGATATLIGTALTSANLVMALYGVQVDSGTTGDIVVTASGASLDCGIGVWALYDLTSQTPVDTGTSTANPSTDSLTTLDNGVAIAFADSANTLATYTWSGLTENFDGTVEATLAHSYSGASANIAVGSNLSISATRTAGVTQTAMVTASFR